MREREGPIAKQWEGEGLADESCVRPSPAFGLRPQAPSPAVRERGGCTAMTHLLDYLADRVLLCDGPIGTQVQARALDIERDFHGHENCTDILCESRPDLVRQIHR